MPSVARLGDTVLSPDGTGYHCAFPMETATGEANDKNVKANGIAVCVEGNLVAAHPKGGCDPDESTVSSFSSTVKIGGKGVARIGDMLGNNIITQGSPNVFAGG